MLLRKLGGFVILGYTWSIVRPVICAAKFSEAPTETAFGREHSVSNIPKNYLDMSHL